MEVVANFLGACASAFPRAIEDPAIVAGGSPGEAARPAGHAEPVGNAEPVGEAEGRTECALRLPGLPRIGGHPSEELPFSLDYCAGSACGHSPPPGPATTATRYLSGSGIPKSSFRTTVISSGTSVPWMTVAPSE